MLWNPYSYFNTTQYLPKKPTPCMSPPFFSAGARSPSPPSGPTPPPSSPPSSTDAPKEGRKMFPPPLRGEEMSLNFSLSSRELFPHFISRGLRSFADNAVPGISNPDPDCFASKDEFKGRITQKHSLHAKSAFGSHFNSRRVPIYAVHFVHVPLY